MATYWSTAWQHTGLPSVNVQRVLFEVLTSGVLRPVLVSVERQGSSMNNMNLSV